MTVELAVVYCISSCSLWRDKWVGKRLQRLTSVSWRFCYGQHRKLVGVSFCCYSSLQWIFQMFCGRKVPWEFWIHLVMHGGSYCCFFACVPVCRSFPPWMYPFFLFIRSGFKIAGQSGEKQRSWMWKARKNTQHQLCQSLQGQAVLGEGLKSFPHFSTIDT